ncbi:MAG TPA: C-GCAxxG-C-C family protein [Geobacteraceae bacterium]|nr:C-GCAxxG-C-C family protein [Geobacteraceae bacterium]
MADDGLGYATLSEEAVFLGEKYTAACRACAPAVFTAVMEALGHGDDPAAREVCKASIGLTGGTGLMATGTCGAVAGATMAVSYSFGLDFTDIEMDMMKMLSVNLAVAELCRRVEDSYGHIQCQEIQFSHWGKSFRFSNPDTLGEFVAFLDDERSGFKCNKLSGAVSGWAVECIMKHNPGFSQRRT